MANFYGTFRTNYFHVKDETKFRDLMTHVTGTEDSVDFWEKKDGDGSTMFAFGAYGTIPGIESLDEDGDTDVDYEGFLDALRDCVADGDAIIMTEVGNEKLRYVSGIATVITSSDIEVLNLMDVAVKKARDMLGDTQWKTQCEY